MTGDYRFVSSIEGPTGMRVEVDITIPENVATDDVLKRAEAALKAATATFDSIDPPL